MNATALAAMTCGKGPPSTIGQPRSTCSSNSSRAEDQPAARSAQGLVRRRGDHVGVGERVLLAL